MHTVMRRIALLLSLAPGLAVAHDSPDHLLSFASGFGHPFAGLDHLLAMIGVGMLAARIKGHSIWALPLIFMTMLTLGAIAGMGLAHSWKVEAIIAVSIVTLGLLLAARETVRTITAATLSAAFALAHGFAHGTEAAPSQASTYVLGLLLASALLHATGIGAVASLTRLDSARADTATRWAGLAMVLAGVGIAFG